MLSVVKHDPRLMLRHPEEYRAAGMQAVLPLESHFQHIVVPKV